MIQRPKMRLSWIGVLILVAALCAGAFLIARYIVIRRMPALRQAISISASASHAIQPMGSGLIYYDGMTLHALTGQGRQSWNHAAGSTADFNVSNYGVAIWNNTRLTLLTEKGSPIHSSDMQKKVLGAKVGERYAAVQLGEEQNSEILIIERERGGRSVDTISFENLTILDFDFFSNGNLLWVLTLNTDGTVPLCMISTYQPGRTLAGTISESDQILYKVIFQSSQIYAVGSKYIRSYDLYAKENVANRKLVYGWHAVSIDREPDQPLMAFAPIAQNSLSSKISDIRMIKGNDEQSLHFPMECFSVHVNKGYVYGFSNQYVFCARMGDKKPTAYALPIYADNVFGVTGDGSAIVSSGGGVYLVPLTVR